MEFVGNKYKGKIDGESNTLNSENKNILNKIKDKFKIKTENVHVLRCDLDQNSKFENNNKYNNNNCCGDDDNNNCCSDGDNNNCCGDDDNNNCCSDGDNNNCCSDDDNNNCCGDGDNNEEKDAIKENIELASNIVQDIKLNKFEFSKSILMDEANVKFIKVDKVTKQTKDEYLFRFNTPMNHDPGQFLQVSIFGMGEAPMSICSYSKDYFEMSVRNVGNVSSKICALKKGDVVGIRGPYGNGYPMKQLEENNIVVIGGGSGVAPVRGIIQYIEQNRDKFEDVDIFFGFRTMMDMLFTSDYDAWKKTNMNLDIIFSENSTHPKYKKTGLITNFINENDTFNSNEKKIVFVCGPPIMIKATCKKLLEKGFNKDQIFISEERHMKCGVGRCGHCMIGEKYCCTDGPVFRYDDLVENGDW